VLTLTPAAAEVVGAISSASGVPETGGLRIAPAMDPQQESGLELQLVEAPAAGDEVVTEPGARVFLEPRAADYLADKVLDGGLDAQGRPSFTVLPQAGNDGVPAPA
jgi:Fe-S cluster assembly iron-binding protein IscA